MQVENIECQIAQAQIGNFLAGSGLSEETIRQLEGHIAECVDCKTVLNERRDELKAMLTNKREPIDFEQIAKEAEQTKATSFATALRKKSLQQMLEPTMELPFIHQPKAVVQDIEVEKSPAVLNSAKPKVATSWKPLVYSLGLAAVLIGMSLFSKNIAAVFGPRASEATTLAVTKGPEPDVVANPNTPEKLATQAGSNTSNSAIGILQPVAAEIGGGTTNKPPTEPKSEPNSGPSTESTTGDPVGSTPPAGDLIESESIAATALGASAGALATTQFEAVEPNPVPPKVAKTNPTTASKPAILKAPAKQVAARKITRRKPIRRAAPRKAAPVRSRGIKVYNP